MRRILLLAGLLILGGCATAPDYRYVSADGGYYTADDGHASRDWDVSVYGGFGGYYAPGWYGYGDYGYGWGYPPYRGFGPYWNSYWGYSPFYGSYWPRITYYHVRQPRPIRHRRGLYQEHVTQAGSLSRSAARTRPTAIERGFPPGTTPRAGRQAPVNGFPPAGSRPIVPRGTPRAMPRTTPVRAVPQRTGTRSTTPPSPRLRTVPKPRTMPAPLPSRSSDSRSASPRGKPARFPAQR